MDLDALLHALTQSPSYRGQIVHLRREPARPPAWREPGRPLGAALERALAAGGVGRLYTHQADALELARAGRDPLVVTGSASGKSLCYQLPVLEALAADPAATALLLFPSKALCQDQFLAFADLLHRAGMHERLAGVYDGDTPMPLRRRLRDRAAVLFSNPDMLHAGLMPQHGRWARFLGGLRLVALDELHVYSGIFGANMANVLRRLLRLCAHYGADPRLVACSATVGNPSELARAVTGREMALVARDGSPRGARAYVFWNPPVERPTRYRARRSANVEAHDLMALLMQRDVRTIAFSKAKMTAEMIARYVAEKLRETAPHLSGAVAPYRGGYLPEERRAIEARLFGGDLLGVSATPALELGIDVGGLDAALIVGYPGTRASFFQQAGRAGRGGRESLVVLVGLDTLINQYVLRHPDHLFERPPESGVVEPDNPFVLLGHLRCAVQEIPLPRAEEPRFGPHAAVVLRVLADNRKVRLAAGAWYHAAEEMPHHEFGLRGYANANVALEDAASGAVIGELNEYDAPSIVHPHAIYMHRGDTWRVLDLDMERKRARVVREETDYYTQPSGGTDVHHVDACLRARPFGAGRAFWGEVTARFVTFGYEKIRFYTLDAFEGGEVDPLELWLETMAVWIVPPEELMARVLRAGLDPHSGLRGIGYAARMTLPLFVACDTADFSHSVGCRNAPWNAVFVYERHPLGLGYTEAAYRDLHRVLPAVLDTIRGCGCANGCPCCVGKPLRQQIVFNPERGEASIPSKAAARMILEGLLGDGAGLQAPDDDALTDTDEAAAIRLERALRRRLERGREPQLPHVIAHHLPVRYPDPEDPSTLAQPDAARRSERRRDFHRALSRRIAERAADLPASEPVPPGPNGAPQPPPPAAQPQPPSLEPGPRSPGDSQAARARRRLRERRAGEPDGQ
ncbi:MAG: DEAD/DEAH box helicase [Chthonomonadales bacterium]|nr:DEAD/DEAH box helicase [Chthonomonadales bacterium]